MFYELNTDDLDCTVFYTFSIYQSKQVYFFTETEDVLRWFGDLVENYDDTPLDWSEVKEITKVQSIKDFERSKFREWKKSWLLFEEEIEKRKIILCSNIIDESTTHKPSNEDDFFEWLFDINEGSKFCFYDGDLYCKKELGLYCDEDVGVFLGYFKDILHPPIVKNFEISVNDDTYAYFLIHEEFTNDRSQLLDEIKNVYNEHEEKVKQLNLDLLKSLFSFDKYNLYKKLKNEKKIEVILEKGVPHYHEMLFSGYNSEEIVGLDYLFDEFEDIHFSYWSKKLESGQIEIFIETKMASKILSGFLGED